MKTKTRNILVVIGVILVIFAGIAGYVGYSIYSFLSRMTTVMEIPDELKEARVYTGADFLAKTEFFKLEEGSLLKALGKGAQSSDEKERQKISHSETAKSLYKFSDIKVFGNEIIAAGVFGAYVFEPDGRLKREILFEPTIEKIKIAGYEQESFQTNLDNLRIVELEKNKFGFSAFDSVRGVTIFDDQGNQIWSYGKKNVDLSALFQDEKEREKDFEKSTHVLEAAVGDLDGDSIAEYIVARNSDGIRVFDRGGNEKWFEKDNFPSNKLIIVDIDGDGKNELLEAGNSSKIRDASGKLLRKIEGGKVYDMVLFTEDKTKKKAFTFCSLYENKLTCRDEAKNTVFNADAPLSDVKLKNPGKMDVPDQPAMSLTDDSENTYEEKAVWVNWRQDKSRYLAVIASFIRVPRAHFYVYDEKGTLVYHELLPEDAETIAVLGAADQKQEILVGGKNTIWKFSAK